MNNRIEAAVSELTEAIFEQVATKQDTFVNSIHVTKAPLYEWPSWDLPLYYAHDKQPEQEAPADDFADVMRNGLGAIVAWFNEDAGNTEPDPEEDEGPIECYALNVVADVYRDGHAELEVFSEDDVYLGDIQLTADEVCKLFND